jgi:hypothetical protein
MKLVKIIVTVPESHADAVRKAAGEMGAGALGNYSHASFSVKGVGRFIPEENARPAIGRIGALEEVVEERIEWTCEAKKAQAVVEAIRAVHPYEEPAIDVYPLEAL